MSIVNRPGEGARRFESDDALDVRLEGLTLRVANVERSIEFYGGKLGLGLVAIPIFTGPSSDLAM
jgi:hypothetical protein